MTDTPTTTQLPQDLRALGYPVCDRAADEIERLRTALAIYANPKHWTFRDEGAWDTIFIGPPGPDREGWEIAAEALK